MKINRHQIPGYEITDVVASGGMGTVFKAHQSSLDKVVALKVLSPALARDTTYVERFVREAKSLAKLNHPNVVTVIDVGRAGEHYYLVMEYIRGEPLSEMIDKRGPLPESEALSIIRSVACALEHAEKHHLIHRDIKPDNVLLSEEGICKLCDLGLARPAGSSSNLTAAGIAMGTPEYIAPEQARGESELDIRTDIYSLGATLFDAVTGHAPFEGPTPAHIMRSHIDQQLAFPEKPELSLRLRELIQRMMSKDPRDRHQNARELIEDIDLVLAGKRIKKRPVLPSSGLLLKAVRGMHRHLVIVACAIGAAAAAIIFLALLVPAPEPPPAKPDIQKDDEERGKEEMPGIQRERGRDRTVPKKPEPVRRIDPPGRQSAILPEAQIAYEEAEDFSKNPHVQISEIIAMFRSVAEKYAETPWGEKALARAEELENRQERLTLEAQEELAQVRQEVTLLLKEKKYHEAILALTSFAARHEKSASAKSARQLARQLVPNAAKSFASACTEASSLAAQGRYAEARSILLSLKQTGIPELSQIVDKRLSELSNNEMRSQLDENARNRARLYRELLLELLEVSRRDGTRGALTFVSSAGKQGKYEPISDLVKLEETDLRNAVTVLNAAEDGLRQRIGSVERLQYRNGAAVWGKVVEVGGGTVTIAPQSEPNRNATLTITELDDRQIVNLTAYGKVQISATCKLLFYVGRGNLEEALKIIDNASMSLSGEKRIHTKLLLLRKIYDEEKAERFAGEVSSLYRSKRFGKAAEAARKLFEEYSHTEYLVKNAETLGQYVPQTGLVRAYSRISSFNTVLGSDVDVIPSFSVNKQFLESRSTLHIRWEGLLDVPAEGKYEFHVMTTGSARLELAGRSVLRESADPELTITSVTKKLSKGLTEIKLELTCPRGKSAILHVFWQREGGRRLPLAPTDVSHFPALLAEYKEKMK